MTRNTMNSINRISVPLLPESEPKDGAPPSLMEAMHFERSDVPGHIRVFHNGTWQLVAGTSILNMLINLCPTYDQPKPPIPPRPLRPIS